jgi:hypothetical protein
VNFAEAQIAGQATPVIVTGTHAQVSPPILSGHPVEADNQIVLGAATLAQLRLRVGDTVAVSYGVPDDAPVYIPPTRLLIVGTATLPAVGTAQALHTSMGTGALIPAGIQPPAMTRFLRSPNPTLNGPAAVFVRLRNGVTPAAGLRSMRQIAMAGTRAFQALPSSLYDGQSVEVLPVQYPAEIEDYRTIGATPVFLATGLAAGAAAALGLTLIASVRRRRRDLALLKALGLTRRQLASCVAWQSTVAATAGVVAGIPSGVALGDGCGSCSLTRSAPCQMPQCRRSPLSTSPSARSRSPTSSPPSLGQSHLAYRRPWSCVRSNRAADRNLPGRTGNPVLSSGRSVGPR